jgi:hypothetical protein
MNHQTHLKTLDLASGDLLRLPDARGTTLRVTRGTLWITQDRDVNDIVLAAGDTWTIERDGLTLVEAQADAIVYLSGRAVAAVRLRRNGRKPKPRASTFVGWLLSLRPTQRVPYY